MRPGIQPGDAAPQLLDVQLSSLQVNVIDTGDFQLPAPSRLECGSNVHHLVVIEIQAGDGESETRLPGLLFDAQVFPAVVEFDHGVPFRIPHRVDKDKHAFLNPGSTL